MPWGADSHELIGLVPAAGRATRLGHLPCSKEVLPIGWELGPSHKPRAIVACEPLLRQMHRAGVVRALVVVADGKWDVLAFLGDGQCVGLDLAYLVMADSPSTAHTVARACPHIGDVTTVFGFPDLVLRPDDALSLIVDRHSVGDADVVLALFPTDDSSLFDMVETDGETVREIVIKPPATNLRLTWLAAVWSVRFTEFVNAWAAAGSSADATPGRELYIGDVVQAAIAEGLAVVGVEVPAGGYDDIGVPGGIPWRPLTG